MGESSTPEDVQAIAKQAWGSAQKIAMQIAILPAEQRERAFKQSVGAVTQAAEVFGIWDHQRDGWITLQMNLIRAMVDQIVASGQSYGGNA
jgi:hypothetical protein